MEPMTSLLLAFGKTLTRALTVHIAAIEPRDQEGHAWRTLRSGRETKRPVEGPEIHITVKVA
jgi:hypothetical protein